MKFIVLDVVGIRAFVRVPSRARCVAFKKGDKETESKQQIR